MRKGLWYILVLVVLAGCTSREIDRRLAQVNDLANNNLADSAMLLLGEIDKFSLNEYNSRYHDLMTIKTRDKAYLDIKSDTLITEIIRYFEDNGTDDVKGEAYYYGGRVYREIGDAPQALDYFQKALDVLDDTHTRLKGKISSQMGQIFMSLCMYEQARPKFINSIKFFELDSDTAYMICDLRNLGEIYHSLGENDSAMACYNRALDIVSQFEPGSKKEIDVRDNICDYYISERAFDKAIKEYRTMEALYQGDVMPDYLLMTGMNICIIEKDYDKLEKLAHQLLQSSSIYSKKYAYETLAQFSKFKQDTKATFDYVMKFKECFDSIDDSASREAIIHQNSFYNYSLREKENQNLREYKAYTRYLYVFSFSTVVIIILGLFNFIAYKKQTKLTIYLREEKIKQIEQKLKELEKLQSSEKEKATVVGDNIKADFLKLIEINTQYKCTLPEGIVSSSIYNQFKASAKSNVVRIDDEDWCNLEKLVLSYYPKFKATLVMLFSSINDYEFQICLLTKCQFSNKDISTLTYHSASSVTNTRSRLFEKIFSKKGSASDMDRLIALL